MKASVAESNLPDARGPSSGPKIGRPVTVGDERINLFVSPEDRKQVDATIRRSRDLGRGEKLTVSYIFREGARRFIRELTREMDLESDGLGGTHHSTTPPADSQHQPPTTEASDLFTVDSNILGGRPVFRGTRVPVNALFVYLENNYTINEFLECFPSVTREAAFGLLERSQTAVLGKPDFEVSTLEELEAKLLVGVEQIERGEGIPGEECFRRAKKQVRKAR